MLDARIHGSTSHSCDSGKVRIITSPGISVQTFVSVHQVGFGIFSG